MSELPPIDLNNLFKYAVPKLDGLTLTTYYKADYGIDGFCACVDSKTNTSGDHDHEDPALALFWAIYEVMKSNE